MLFGCDIAPRLERPHPKLAPVDLAQVQPDHERRDRLHLDRQAPAGLARQVTLAPHDRLAAFAATAHDSVSPFSSSGFLGCAFSSPPRTGMTTARSSARAGDVHTSGDSLSPLNCQNTIACGSPTASAKAFATRDSIDDATPISEHVGATCCGMTVSMGGNCSGVGRNSYRQTSRMVLSSYGVSSHVRL